MRDENCTACPLHLTAKTICVEGRVVAGTNAGAPCGFVVGEAPGPREDEAGRPFVGASGRMLEDALAAAGVERYFLTNAVRCYPARKALTPKASEVKACRPYLDAEIERRKPVAILACGGTAWHRLGGVGSITEHAGKEVWSDKYQCWIMPVLHPAALLHQGRRGEDAWKLTIHRYATLLKGGLLAKPPVTVRTCATADDLAVLQGMLLNGRAQAAGVAYDFETNAKPWWSRDFRPISVSFSWDGETAWVVPLWHPESPFRSGEWPDDHPTIADSLGDFLDFTKTWLVRRDIPKGGHNSAFFDDLCWYWLCGVLPYSTFDTMAGLHLLDENAPRALKWNGRARLGWPDWGIDRLDLMNQPLEKVAFYNGCDAAATWKMKELVADGLAADPHLADYYRAVTMPQLRAVAQIMARGIHVDPAALRAATQDQQRALGRAAALLPIANPGSPVQVGKWLYTDLGLPVLKTTDTGQPSTDEETIKTLAQEHPEVRKILDWRRPSRNLSAYLGPIAGRVALSFDGREHSEYRCAKVETGRLASPFHTTPRQQLIRRVYSAPHTCVLLSGDYAQIEARLVAWSAAGCPPTWESLDPRFSRMLLAFRAGLDVYILTAAEALGKPPERVETDKANPMNERQVMGKVPTLASLYWISAQGLRAYAWREFEIAWSLPQAQHVWGAFHRAWPEIHAWHLREQAAILHRGWQRNAVGRLRRLPEALHGDRQQRDEAVKAGINFPIQGLAWDLCSTALASFTDDPRVQTLGVFPVGTVHDSILVECPDREPVVREACSLLRSHMLAAPLRLAPLGLRLPPDLIQVGLEVGPWGAGAKPETYLTARYPLVSAMVP